MSYALQIAAALQLFVAALNLFLPRILGWRDALATIPDLLREVYHVHAFFVSLTLAIFATLTLGYGDAMLAGEPGMRALARAIGIFWAVRVATQVFYYSSSHWRGKAGRTAIHVALLLMYGGLSAVYLLA